MKILVFTSQFCHGAAERLAAELAIDLNRRGIHADVMGLYSEGFEGSKAAKEELLARGVPVVHFLELDPSPSLFRLVASAFKLNGILRRHKYDIVETSSKTPGLVAAWAGFGTPARHLVGVHYVFEKSEPIPLSMRILMWSVRFRHGTRFYAVSQSAKSAWHESTGVPGAHVRTIYNSIDIEASASAREGLCGELGISAASKIILCAGRLSSYKRQDLVLDAFASIATSGNLVLIFAGETDEHVPGSRKMVSEMRNKIREAGLEGRVFFLGRRTDLRALMASVDLLVHATQKEAFGLVLAEALAEGLPIVSTDVEGIPEVLDGTDSFLVRPDDAKALAMAVCELLSLSPEDRDRARAKGKSRAKRFSRPERTVRMIKCFEDLMSGSF